MAKHMGLNRLETLANKIIGEFTECGMAGCNWYTRRFGRGEPYELHIAPATVEIEGGAGDGENVFEPVSYDLAGILKLFSKVDACYFRPSCPDDGVRVEIEGSMGEFSGVAITLHSEAIQNDPPVGKVNINNGSFTPKP